MTSARTWLRVTAVLLALFALGHTLGTATPQVTRGAPEAAVLLAMQAFRFPIMGFTRSHWDFYRGFAITIGMLQAILALVAWQAGDLAARDARAARPFTISILIACLGLAILSTQFFFAAPIILSAMVAGTTAIAIWRLNTTVASETRRRADLSS